MASPSPSKPLPLERLLVHRRRVAWGAAALIAAFLPLDLAYGPSGRTAAQVRIGWLALMLIAIALQRPSRPRLAAAATRLIGVASALALAGVVAWTGGASGVYFSFLLALPLGAMVMAPDLPSAAALTSLVATAAGAALLMAEGRPPLQLASWVLMCVAAGALTLWGAFLYVRAWETEMASERARRAAAEDLARSERRRATAEKLATVGRLAAGIAHEVNNPLAYVKGNVEWLAEALPSGQCTVAEARGVLAETAGGLDHMARVVADLQAFARDDREAPGPCTVQELIDAALRLGSARLSSVPELAVEIEPRLPPVHGHARRIAQALLNLLVNAADAVEGQKRTTGMDHGYIRVRARTQGERVTIEVEDSGPGVSEEAAAHLFEPFFTTKGERGTGLGLALSRENVVGSGGTLEHEAAPGGGALFRISLRTAEAASEARPASSGEARS